MLMNIVSIDRTHNALFIKEYIIKLLSILKLYSTATQNHSHWVLALAWTPTPQCYVTYTNMLVSKNAKICVTPNANPKICVFTLAMYISFLLCRFHLRWLPFFSGIWAYGWPRGLRCWERTGRREVVQVDILLLEAGHFSP